MTRHRHWLKEGFTVTSIVALFIVTLPLLAAAVFFMRAAIVGGLLLALCGGLVLIAVSPAFRRWLDLQSEGALSYNGLQLATDVSVFPAHSWARPEGRNVTVGADDLVPKVLGPIERVELPAPGEKFTQGQRLFRVRHGGRSVEVLSPVSGTVVDRNESLASRPGQINDSPYGRGWTVRMRPDDLRRDAPQLLRGEPARKWFRGETDLLLGTVLAASPALPDGGTFVGDLHAQIDDQAWQALDRLFFHNPNGRW